MVEWSRDHYIDPATTGLNTVRVIQGDEKEATPGQSVTNDVIDGGGEGEERGVRHESMSAKHGGGEGEVGERVADFETRKMRKDKMQQGTQL